MVTPSVSLAPDYQTARAGFLERARPLADTLTEHAHELAGPDGGTLALDVATLGPADADDALLVVSGTHGVEGFAGSAIQQCLLDAYASGEPPIDLDTGVRLVMVHALNPFGFAHVRRVNEDNIDLNRNRIDHANPPERSGYDRLAAHLVPTDWSPETQQATTEAILDVAAEVGPDALQEMVSGGQYHHPTGLFYGGTGVAWSHRVMDEVIAEHLDHRARVAILDLHTGLGEWGAGEIICGVDPAHESFDTLGAWFGDQLASPEQGDSVSAELNGEWLDHVADTLTTSGGTATQVLPVALEFGTIDLTLVIQALRADAWLHAHGDPSGPAAPAIKADLRKAFADDDPAWLAAIWSRTLEVIEMISAGFADK